MSLMLKSMSKADLMNLVQEQNLTIDGLRHALKESQESDRVGCEALRNADEQNNDLKRELRLLKSMKETPQPTEPTSIIEDLAAAVRALAERS